MVSTCVGLKGEHRFWERTAILALAYATMGITVNGIKAAVGEQRPDSPARNSFPSGHTATAFMGAEFLWQEYGRAQPLIGYTGYAVATATGLLRIYNNRHWVNDVVAGAAIGMLSTKFAYWLFPRIFTRHEGKQNHSDRTAVIRGRRLRAQCERGNVREGMHGYSFPFRRFMQAVASAYFPVLLDVQCIFAVGAKHHNGASSFA